MNMPYKMSGKINIWKLCILKILADEDSNGLHKHLQMLAVHLNIIQKQELH